MNIFASITAGDSANWHDAAVQDALGRSMTSTDWVLTYHLRGTGTLDIVAAPDGDGWNTTLTTDASATLTAGAYLWSATLSKTGQRVTIGSGMVSVKPDLGASNATIDARTVAVKALEDCEKALASFNSTGGKVKKYMIGSREMEFQSLADLMQVLRYWKLRVSNEAAADKIASGHGNPNTLRIRFT